MELRLKAPLTAETKAQVEKMAGEHRTLCVVVAALAKSSGWGCFLRCCAPSLSGLTRSCAELYVLNLISAITSFVFFRARCLVSPFLCVGSDRDEAESDHGRLVGSL